MIILESKIRKRISFDQWSCFSATTLYII